MPATSHWASCGRSFERPSPASLFTGRILTSVPMSATAIVCTSSKPSIAHNSKIAPSLLRQFLTFSKEFFYSKGAMGMTASTVIASKLYFTLKFQQLTGPVMAKGLEDTACYVYTRFVSANEVGGSPADFGIAISDFHQRNEDRATNLPHSMLSTSTHDTQAQRGCARPLECPLRDANNVGGTGDEVASHQPDPQREVSRR